jgi:hypothetical protein
LHEGLFSKAMAGSKVLVETYHNVVCAALDFVCDVPGTHTFYLCKTVTLTTSYAQFFQSLLSPPWRGKNCPFFLLYYTLTSLQ